MILIRSMNIRPWIFKEKALVSLSLHFSLSLPPSTLSPRKPLSLGSIDFSTSSAFLRNSLSFSVSQDIKVKGPRRSEEHVHGIKNHENANDEKDNFEARRLLFLKTRGKKEGLERLGVEERDTWLSQGISNLKRKRGKKPATRR